MRLPRLGLRMLMTLVLISSLMMWGALMWRRSRYYDSRARIHRMRDCLLRVAAHDDVLRKAKAGDHPDRDYYPEIGTELRHAAYELMLRRKYERAARRPWLRLGPDPPPPHWTCHIVFDGHPKPGAQGGVAIK